MKEYLVGTDSIHEDRSLAETSAVTVCWRMRLSWEARWLRSTAVVWYGQVILLPLPQETLWRGIELMVFWPWLKLRRCALLGTEKGPTFT